ncbi:GGDEF domain-containing protein [Nitrosomonas sp. HPC101]|uniref:GGDEF domain-containing protein n=1 Tax=Nitrosomonas sp. HPC101 TaxID=1658667 RepID=UPI00136B26B4|nr:GGDEF domain-containing protein [Nitrosomonas sp. HPC101]MXS84705.1 GGDEF domain-containing protein [Nitrosomonas sp. HPC101]
MQISDEKKVLQLVKSSIAGKKKNKIEEKNQKPIAGADEYSQQVEQYACRIRETSNVDEIIDILDTVLGETRSLRYSNEIYSAQEQVRLAENQIELLKQELEQLREFVHYDQMTGAFNRRGLDAIYLREAARADRNENTLCAVMFDLDDFKRINDVYGHQFGDDVLIHLVKLTKKSLRPSDVVARYSGEKFVVLLPDVTLESAVWVMQRLQNSFSKKTLADMDGNPVPIVFSGGVAFRQLRESQKSLFKRADEALCQAKKSGKGRIMVAP